MNSQIQCPVCTLFLHAGMNLQDHLETHPKEKVIAALVNMTLLQQQTNDAEDASNFQCSRYEPLSDEIEPVQQPANMSVTEIVQPRKQIAHYIPSEKQGLATTVATTAPTPRRVMIVNNRVSRVFQTPATGSLQTTTENRASRTQTIPKAVTAASTPSRIIHLITTNVSASSSTVSIPPPYDTTVASGSNSNSSSSYSSLSETQNSNDRCDVVVERDRAMVVRKKQPPSFAISIVPSGSADSEEKVQSRGKEPAPTASTSSSSKKASALISSGLASSDSSINSKEQYAENGACANSGSSTQDNMVIDETCSVIHMNDTFVKDEQTTPTNLVHKRKSSDKFKPGLKVLSDVKLSPNAAVNISSLNAQLSEPINLDQMILVGPSTKLMKKVPSHSKARREETVRDIIDISRPGPSHENRLPARKPETKNKSSSKSPEPMRDKPSTSRERSNPSPAIIETIDLSIDTKPCSSKATSVIRLASPNKVTHGNEPTVPRPIVKIPFNKPPKKLIVKLKRPFVPVIEEEANLHAPELPGVPLKATIKQEETAKTTSDTEIRLSSSKKSDNQLLECSEDVPFSPLRQSYTPLPPMEEVEFVITELSDETELNDEADNPSTSLDAYNNSDFVADLVGMHGDIPQIVEDGDFDDRIPIVNVTSDGTVDESWPSASTSAQSKNQSSSYADVKPDREAIYNASTSMSSEPSSSSQSNFRPSAFLGYNEQHEGEYFYSSDRLSSAGFTNENNTWSQRFSPQYMPLMGVDSGKNTSSGDRAPSTDSLNIRTDEKMPAKGEISEQESNGDGSWSHQVRPFD